MFLPELRCSVEYGSVGELEAISDWGRERVRYEDERVDRDGWMVKSSRRYFAW